MSHPSLSWPPTMICGRRKMKFPSNQCTATMLSFHTCTPISCTPITTTMKKWPYERVSWNDTTESELSCDALEENQASRLTNLELEAFFAAIPAEIKIQIWSEVLLVDEQSIQYELLLRSPQHGGASVRAIVPEHQLARRRRVRDFSLISREAYTAVRDTYVRLPRHSGKYPVDYRQLCDEFSSLTCPKRDRFIWVMSDEKVPPYPAFPTWPEFRYPSIQDFLDYLPMPDSAAHPMFPWPGDIELYRKFGKESHLILDSIRHLDMTLPALSGQVVHDMEKGLEAFPNLWTVTISTRIPKPGNKEPSRPSVSGPLGDQAWKRYVAQNDPMVKAALNVELRRHFKGIGSAIPTEWGRILVHPLAATLMRMHVGGIVGEAEKLYGMGCREWTRFFELYDILVKRDIKVSIVSGHYTSWMTSLRW